MLYLDKTTVVLSDTIVKLPKPKSNLNILQALSQRQLGAKTNFNQNFSNSLFCANRLQIEYQLKSKPISAMCFDPTGEIIASFTRSHVNLWFWKKRNIFYTRRTSNEDRISIAKFLNLGGGYHIVTGGMDGEVRYQHIAEDGATLDNLLTKYERYPETIVSDQTQPHDILSCGDKNIQRHDLRVNPSVSNNRIFEYERRINHIDANPRNFNEFLVCTGDRIIRVYDQRNTKEMVHSFSPFSDKESVPRCAFYNYNGEEVLGTYREGVYLFNRTTKMNDYSSAMQGYNNITMQNRAKFFGSQSNYVVSGSECGNLFVWDKKSGAIIKCTLGDEVGEIFHVECHPHEPYLCTIGAEDNIKIWSPLYEANGNVLEIIQKNLRDLYNFNMNPYGFIWSFWVAQLHVNQI